MSACLSRDPVILGDYALTIVIGSKAPRRNLERGPVSLGGRRRFGNRQSSFRHSQLPTLGLEPKGGKVLPGRECFSVGLFPLL